MSGIKEYKNLWKPFTSALESGFIYEYQSETITKTLSGTKINNKSKYRKEQILVEEDLNSRSICNSDLGRMKDETNILHNGKYKYSVTVS